MKYKFQRKLNLANIDKELWPYETEDIGVEDADSFEEGQQVVDKLVAERIGYYKAKAEEYHSQKFNNNSANSSTEVSKTSDAPTSFPPEQSMQSTSENSGMPAEFNI